MMNKSTIQKYILIFILIILTFLVCLRTPVDPDMGWHIRNGQTILTLKSFPKTDLYTYSMPDFPVIFHEWAIDIGMYWLYAHVGLLILSIIFALITAAAFILVARSASAKFEYQLMAALLGSIASINIIGVRPQMVSLLGAALIIYIFYRFKNNQSNKIVYWLPVIFLIWVNLHGGFAIGLLILGLLAGLELLRRLLRRLVKKFNVQMMDWKKWRRLSVMAAVSGLVTLINPYGYRIYEEIVRTALDTYAKQNIMEWLPVKLNQSNALPLIIFLTLFVILLFFAWRRIDGSYLIIILIFGYLGFSSWRNAPLLVLVTIPVWVIYVKYLTGPTLSNFLSSKWAITILLLIAFLLGQQRYMELVPNTKSVVELARKGQYPYEAVQWLKNNSPSGHVFNEYNWGGFLTWQLPELKIFIDGRMAHWKQGDVEILKLHQTLTGLEEGWPAVLERFAIRWAILNANEPLGLVLKAQGWQPIYQDNVAIILRKNDEKK